MRSIRTFYFVATLAALSFSPSFTFGTTPDIATSTIEVPKPPAEPEPRRHLVTLQSAIELALHNNLDLASKSAVVNAAETRQQQARAASYPKVFGTAILSPIYSVTGNAINSQSDLDRWGVWMQSTVTILQPLYTWGKLSSLREAAAHGAEVARAQYRKDTNQIVYEVKELYYGVVLAEQLYTFLEEGKNDVGEIVARTEEDQKKKRPSIPKRDYYRLKVFAAEAEYRFEEAKKFRYLARHALSLKLGYDPDDETLPQDTVINAIESPLPSEQLLVNAMAEHRPEFAQLVNGIAAKKALLHVEKTNKYPILFGGGILAFNYSNVREAQESAYAYDPYNRNTGGAGVGIQWTWDFATTLANEAMLRTEIDELEQKQQYAKVGFRMELKKALVELSESRSRLDTSRDAFKVGRKWLVSETMGYSVGLTEVKNLIDAYLARAKTASDYWQAVFRVNMGWAELSKVVGTEITPTLTNTPGSK